MNYCRICGDKIPDDYPDICEECYILEQARYKADMEKEYKEYMEEDYRKQQEEIARDFEANQ